MKRELSDENDGGNGAANKRNRRNDDMVRLLIPSRIAGAVIGKGGQHIQKMRSQYKATVSVDDCQGPERTILISCDLESLLSTVKEVLKYFEEKDDEVDVRMLIHQSLAGCVIGKGGTKIKEIRDKIGCRILKVFSNVAPQSTDRIVQIVGKQDQCVEAVREVLDVTRDTPIKGSVHNYDPINFDDLFADEYGGYGGMPNGSGGGGGGGGGMGGGMRGGNRQSRFDRRDGGRRFGGNGGGGDRGRRDDRSRSDDRRDREYINPWANDGPLGGRSSNMGSSSFGSNMGGGFGGSGGFGSSFGGGQGGGFGGGSGGGFGGSVGTFGTGGGPTFGSGAGGNGNFGSGPGGNFGSGGAVFGSGSGMGGNSLGNGTSGGMGGGSMGGGNMGNAGGGGGFGGGMNNGRPGGDNKNSTQVTIPKDLAGAIIGKGGGRIRRIRNESGAYITIDEPLPGSNDRIITISGDSKQIQMAQYLLQQSVHENRRKF